MFAKSRHKSRYTHPGTVHPEFKAPACVRRSGLLSLMMIPALVPGNTRPEWAKSFTVGLWTQNTRDRPGMMSRQEPSWGITDFICILCCGRLSIRSYFCKLFTFTLHHEWFILNEHRRNPAIFACVEKKSVTFVTPIWRLPLQKTIYLTLFERNKQKTKESQTT